MTYRIGWARELPRLKASTQKAALLDAGCDRVWMDGEKLPSGRHVNWAWFLSDVRPADIVMVCDGRSLMYPPSGSMTPRRRWFAGLQDVENREGLVETLNGHHNRTPKARDFMTIATLDHDADTSGKSGRPKLLVEPEHLLWMLPIWQSLKIATNIAACDMIRAEAARRDLRKYRKISVSQLTHKLGGSGRDRIKRKPATKAKK